MTDKLSEAEFLSVLRKACEDAGSQRAFALMHNLSPSYVNDVLKGKRGITKRILDAVEYEFFGCYSKKKGAAS